MEDRARQSIDASLFLTGSKKEGWSLKPHEILLHFGLDAFKSSGVFKGLRDMAQKMSVETALSLLNGAAQERRHGKMAGVGKKSERVCKDIEKALKNYEASCGVEGSNGISSANGTHTETTSQPAYDHDTGIQSDDVEMHGNVTMAEPQFPNEVESIDGIRCVVDMSTEIAEEPDVAKDSEFRPHLLLQALEADSRAQSDEISLGMNCTPPVIDTSEDRAVLAIDSSPEESRSSILAGESRSGFGEMYTERRENDAIDPRLLQDRQNTVPGVESEIDPLLDGALKSLQGENLMSTTAIITTLTALNINSFEWLVVEPGFFDSESSRLSGLKDTHRYLITAVNLDNHWTAAVIGRESGNVDIYDPLQQEDIFHRVWSWLVPRLAHLGKHLSMQQDKSPSWQPRKVQCSLKQQDAFNCGIYATIYCIYRLHGLELPQNIYPSSWRRLFAGVLAASNDVELSTTGQRRTLKDSAEDIATFFHRIKNGQVQAESEQILQILAILENKKAQLVSSRTALEEEEQLFFQRLKEEGVLMSNERFHIGPNKAETAIDKVVAMIQEDYHQADAESKAEQDLALDTERYWQERRAGGGSQLR